jgi:hypothetical protein
MGLLRNAGTAVPDYGATRLHPGHMLWQPLIAPCLRRDINFPYRVVYIRFIGTRRQYDGIDAQTV